MKATSTSELRDQLAQLKDLYDGGVVSTAAHVIMRSIERDVSRLEHARAQRREVRS
jgi:hypothetical protein